MMKHTSYYGIKPMSKQEQNAKVYNARKAKQKLNKDLTIAMVLCLAVVIAIIIL